MEMTLPIAPPSPRPSIWSRLLAPIFGSAGQGALQLDLNDQTLLLRAGLQPGPHARVRLHGKRPLLRILLGGENAAAGAFVDGEWTTPDLVETCRYFARNPAGAGWSAIATPRRWLERLQHALNANTRRGSRRNIRFHYDLGNDFYRHWLDDSMAYSSAIWREPGETLAQAQDNKLRRVVELLGDVRDRSILEIGCGWGAQARELARAGARVKGITLSPAQLGHARDVIAASGFTDRVALELEDYRDQSGQYDAIVSIEMAEAVGEANLLAYFETIRRNLRPGGTAVLQVITIAEDRLDGYRRQPDFIQRHIFPGGFLPSKSLLTGLAQRAGLRTVHQQSFGRCYARTLAEWRRNFDASWPEIARLGFDERFRRLWHYYLCYCEAGFLEDCIDVSLFTFR